MVFRVYMSRLTVCDYRTEHLVTCDCPRWPCCGMAKWSWPCYEFMFFPALFLFIVSKCPPPLQAVKVISYGRYAHLLYEGCARLDYSFWEGLHSAPLLELPVTCPSHHLSLDSYHFSPALLPTLSNLPPCFLIHPPSIHLPYSQVEPPPPHPPPSNFVCWPLSPFPALSPAPRCNILRSAFRNDSLSWRYAVSCLHAPRLHHPLIGIPPFPRFVQFILQDSPPCISLGSFHTQLLLVILPSAT